MDQDERRALEAVRRVASMKAKPYTDRLGKRTQVRAENKLKDLGLGPEYLGVAGLAAKLAEGAAREELEGEIDLTDDLKLEGRISPREKAIKLLYEKKF
jgi:hypothetical protein